MQDELGFFPTTELELQVVVIRCGTNNLRRRVNPEVNRNFG